MSGGDSTLPNFDEQTLALALQAFAALASAGSENFMPAPVDELMLNTLVQELGIPEVRARRGLVNSGTVDGALSWLSEHQDDPDIDKPLLVPKPPNAPRAPLLASPALRPHGTIVPPASIAAPPLAPAPVVPSPSSTAASTAVSSFPQDEKVDNSIATLMRYRTGGDGGAALKLLITFVKNIVDHPDDPKYCSINTDSAAFKTKLAPLVGPLALLKAIGFEKDEADGKLKYDRAANSYELLVSTLQRLTQAEAAYRQQTEPTATTAAACGPVVAAQSKSNAAPTSSTGVSSWIVSLLGDQLLTKTGFQSIATALAGKKRVALYFSASWCPPCRQFTPLLAEFYQTIRDEDGSALEIVFVSSDRDPMSFNEYYGHHPWLAVPFSRFLQSIGQQFNISGIPALIVLDVATGSVLDRDGRTTVMQARGNTARALSRHRCNYF